MAPGIAAWCASTGATVQLAGRRLAGAEAAVSAAHDVVREGSRSIEPAPLDAATFASADLVIESVVEDREVKVALLSKLDTWMPHGAALATNTSSLSVQDLGDAVGRTEFLGLHFMYPAHLTQLIEVIPTSKTPPSVVATTSAFARVGGKTPMLVSKELPGFIWNRLQFALLRECLHLLDEGVADIETIDEAVSAGLAARWLSAGPFATADLGGLDTFARVARQLFPALASEDVVSRQLLERATAGGGFYVWPPDSREAVEDLRAQGIGYSRELANRRHDLGIAAEDRLPEASSN
jgi:3-hydroxybutyryl-CoA dehydrogenase